MLVMSALAWADCSNPVVHDLKMVSHMPPTRYQENSQLCFAMSGMQLINRMSCIQTHHCDFGFMFDPGPDEFSLRDALGEYYKDFDTKKFGQGGNPQLFLQTVSRLGKLAPEVCAPLVQLDSLSLSEPGVDINEFLEKLYNDYKAAQTTPACFIATHFPNLQEQGRYLKQFIADVQAALASEELSEFMQKVMLPPRCEGQRRAVPPFTVQNFETGSESALKQKIDMLIDRDTPLAFSHNLYTRVPSTDPDDILGAHAANIMGSRIACCGEKCENQYFVADSSGVTPTERWESQSSVLKSIEELNDVYRFVKNLQSPNPVPMKTPVLIRRVLERAQVKTDRVFRIEDLHLKSAKLTGDEPELIWLEPSQN